MRKRYNSHNYGRNYNYNHMTGFDNKIIINCINCLSKLKVPLDKGTILVTCPVCKKNFLFNPKSIFHTIRQIFMQIKVFILNFKNKKLPLIKFKLKSFFSNNKKNLFISIVVVLILVLVLIVLLLELNNLRKEAPNINIPGKPGPVAFLQ